MNRCWPLIAACLIGGLADARVATGDPPGTALTYQGRLMQSGQTFTGNASMRFSLYDAAVGGNLVGGVIAIIQPVNGGLFTAQLDFGTGILPYIEQSQLWLEVEIERTPLAPRQAITAAPRALHATTAREAANRFNITGDDGALTFATGSIGIDPTISGIVINWHDVYVGDPQLSRPKLLHFGSAIGDPCIGLDPAVGPGLFVGNPEIYVGGPVAMTPKLHLGGVGDPDIKFVRADGSIVIGCNTVVVGDPQLSQPKALRFGGAQGPRIGIDPNVSGMIIYGRDLTIGDPEISEPRTLHFGVGTASPGIGTDPGVAGIIIHANDLTVGNPEDAQARTLHFGVDPRNPRPFIGSSISDPEILVLNASSAIRLDGSFVGVGLASTAAPQFRLDLPNVAGPGGQGRANAWTTYSSRRWKENIRPIEGALDKIGALEGVYFDWKPENGGGHNIGFLAEDVGRVLPELVEWEEDGVSARSLKYDRLSALAIEGIKAQQRDIAELRAQNSVLQARLDSLEARSNASRAVDVTPVPSLPGAAR